MSASKFITPMNIWQGTQERPEREESTSLPHPRCSKEVSEVPQLAEVLLTSGHLVRTGVVNFPGADTRNSYWALS